MKRLLTFPCWIIAGSGMGVLTGTLLFSLWFDLGWREPVADWLSARGMTRIAGYWGLAWLHVPDWLVVGLAGIAAAVFVRRQLLSKITLFCIAFVLAPYLVAVASGFSPLPFGARAFATSMLWSISVISLGITVALSLSAVRGNAKTDRRGFGVSAAA